MSDLLRCFEFPDILKATENFARSLEIGSGGFGKVYLGKMMNDEFVAIKRLNPESKQGQTEFLAEVLTLPMLNHRNIVSLIGYCEYEKEKILVYEYVSNGSIFDHLHKHKTPLSWLRRLNICITAAHGLSYLHNDVGIEFGVIHGDFKSSNVLLHESWEAKISDFGLSKICSKSEQFTFVKTVIKGTFGCLDPNYCQTGRLRRKTDVYAFGVLLLEVLCRKPVLDENFYGEGKNLVKWAQVYIKKGDLKYITDPDILNEISTKCLKKFFSIVESCFEDLGSRPTMDKVVVGLEHVLALQEKSSLQPRGRTRFSRLIDAFLFSSNKENSVRVQPNGPGASVG